MVTAVFKGKITFISSPDGIKEIKKQAIAVTGPDTKGTGTAVIDRGEYYSFWRQLSLITETIRESLSVMK